MKKVFMLMVMVLLVLGTTPFTMMAKNFNVGVEAGYFAPSNSDFSDLYGSGGQTFGVNAAYRFPGNVSIHTAFDLYGADSKTVVTEDDISINLSTLRIGSYYHFNLRKIMPKAGAGLAVTWLKETDPFGGSSRSKAGWFVGAGVDIPVARKILAGVELLYYDVKIGGEFGNESIGGISLLLNLKLRM